jgi:hypothetical protein
MVEKRIWGVSFACVQLFGILRGHTDSRAEARTRGAFLPEADERVPSKKRERHIAHDPIPQPRRWVPEFDYTLMS